MKKDADEKSDDDGERLATASERALLFEGPSFIATTDERRMMMCSNRFKHVFTRRYTSFTYSKQTEPSKRVRRFRKGRDEPP